MPDKKSQPRNTPIATVGNPLWWAYRLQKRWENRAGAWFRYSAEGRGRPGREIKMLRMAALDGVLGYLIFLTIGTIVLSGPLVFIAGPTPDSATEFVMLYLGVFIGFLPMSAAGILLWWRFVRSPIKTEQPLPPYEPLVRGAWRSIWVLNAITAAAIAFSLSR